jgi:hypothetical protein
MGTPGLGSARRIASGLVPTAAKRVLERDSVGDSPVMVVAARSGPAGSADRTNCR